MKLEINFIVALLLIALIPFSAFAADGQIKIAQTASTTFPIIINKPGSYVLTSNLVISDPDANAIEIKVNDVTVDLNGHKIQGPGAGLGDGIYALDRYNVTIRNGRIWGFWVGIDIHHLNNHNYKSAGHRIEGIQVANNSYVGIVVNAGIITKCSANNNGSTGIWAINCFIAYCIANNNGQDGFQVEESIISYCTAQYNQQAGINDIGKSRIEGNNLRNNNSDGLSLHDDGASYVIKNTASDNGSENFYNSSGNYMPTTGDNANYGF